MRRDQIGKINENLTAHLFVPGQPILLRETTVTDTEKTWWTETEQRSLYVTGKVKPRYMLDKKQTIKLAPAKFQHLFCHMFCYITLSIQRIEGKQCSG